MSQHVEPWLQTLAYLLYDAVETDINPFFSLLDGFVSVLNSAGWMKAELCLEQLEGQTTRILKLMTGPPTRWDVRRIADEFELRSTDTSVNVVLYHHQTLVRTRRDLVGLLLEGVVCNKRYLHLQQTYAKYEADTVALLGIRELILISPRSRREFFRQLEAGTEPIEIECELGPGVAFASHRQPASLAGVWVEFEGVLSADGQAILRLFPKERSWSLPDAVNAADLATVVR